MNFGIIAAGEGSRLRTEGVEFPKPLVPINGKPMIGRLIDIFEECGAESISIIINNEMTEVREFLVDKISKMQVPGNLIVKSTPSSMHSFYELSESFNGEGRFILTTVDTIFHENDFKRYAQSFDQAPDYIDGMMAVTPHIDDEKPLYVKTDENFYITAFLDSYDQGVKYVSGGIYGLSQKALPVLQKCIDKGVSRMRNFQRALVESGLKLKAYPIEKIIDVDHASDIAKAESFLKTDRD